MPGTPTGPRGSPYDVSYPGAGLQKSLDAGPEIFGDSVKRTVFGPGSEGTTTDLPLREGLPKCWLRWPGLLFCLPGGRYRLEIFRPEKNHVVC